MNTKFSVFDIRVGDLFKSDVSDGKLLILNVTDIDTERQITYRFVDSVKNNYTVTYSKDDFWDGWHLLEHHGVVKNADKYEELWEAFGSKQ